MNTVFFSKLNTNELFKFVKTVLVDWLAHFFKKAKIIVQIMAKICDNIIFYFL